MQLTRIPSPTWSAAIALVKATTAPLEALYAHLSTWPFRAATEAALMITPHLGVTGNAEQQSGKLLGIRSQMMQ